MRVWNIQLFFFIVIYQNLSDSKLKMKKLKEETNSETKEI